MKALVGAFNQEKALVAAFSVIVKTGCGTDGTDGDCYRVLQATDEQGLLRLAAARLGRGDQVLRDEGESHLVLPQLLLSNANTK